MTDSKRLTLDSQAVFASAASYGLWLWAVDEITSNNLGCSVHDMIEVPFMAWYNAKVTPEEAALRCEEFAT